MPELSEILQPGSHWGFLGGAFDPPHTGHLALARTLCDCAGLAGALLCPTFAPPHKRAPHASFEQRLAMTRLLVESEPSFVVTDVERTLLTPSYTIQTIRALQSRYPAVRFSILLGGDNLEILSQWYHIDELLSLAPALVGCRPGSVATIPERFAGLVTVCEGELTDVSSTEIRRLIAENGVGEASGLTPAPVLDFIENNGLYQ